MNRGLVVSCTEVTIEVMRIEALGQNKRKKEGKTTCPKLFCFTFERDIDFLPAAVSVNKQKGEM